jgi:hypothetical protein
MTVARQEQLRSEILPCYLEDYLALIKKIMPSVPAELIFNLDETGLSDWEDRITQAVFVPATEGDSKLHYPINRAMRHHTLICCVAASESIIVRCESHQTMEQENFSRRELFCSCIEEIFFPAVATNRELPACGDKLCIFFCDNGSIHCSDPILERFAEKGDAVITYPTHMSNIFQVLDALFSERLKSAKR